MNMTVVVRMNFDVRWHLHAFIYFRSDSTMRTSTSRHREREKRSGSLLMRMPEKREREKRNYSASIWDRSFFSSRRLRAVLLEELLFCWKESWSLSNFESSKSNERWRRLTRNDSHFPFSTNTKTHRLIFSLPRRIVQLLLVAVGFSCCSCHQASRYENLFISSPSLESVSRILAMKEKLWERANSPNLSACFSMLFAICLIIHARSDISLLLLLFIDQ